MENLYILSPGTQLRKEGDTLKIMEKGTLLQTIPAKDLKQLILAGRTSISGQVLEYLIENKIDTVFLSQECRFRARLLLDEGGHVALRCAQYQRLQDPSYAGQTASAIVHSKIEAQKNLFKKKRKQGSATKTLHTLIVQLSALQRQLTEPHDIDRVRGIEGFAAKLYFSGFSQLILNQDFTFHERNKRPPLDPINALLSFIYTMFTNEVINAIQTSGLDPYLGCLHTIAHGRPSLACDLVEEWRSLADNMVLYIINKRMLKPNDFLYNKKSTTRPVSMKPATLRTVIAAYKAQMEKKVLYPHTGKQTSLRWILFSQAKRFAEAVEMGSIYTPFPSGASAGEFMGTSAEILPEP